MNIALTGHRPQFFPTENTDGWIGEVCDTFRNRLKFFKIKNDIVVLTGACYGWDIMGAEIALEEDVSIKCCIPFPGFGKNFPDDWKDRHQAILKASSETILCSEEYSKNCFFIRDRYMVDNSDIVCSLLHPDAKKGGTFYTINYAIKNRKPVLNHWVSEKKDGIFD